MTFKVIPNIEIKQGRCVILKGGRFDDDIDFDISPLDAAKAFEKSGAKIIQVIDVDALLMAGDDNTEVIESIIKNTNVPIQVGGGIRTLYQIHQWIERGADKVVLGTAAIRDQRMVFDACKQYPDKILVSIDARDGFVVIDGWREKTPFRPIDLARAFENQGVAGIIYTDLDGYDGNPEAGLAMTTLMATGLNVPLISSGLIYSLDDISTLKKLPDIAGTITGRALFTKQFKLEDALTLL